MTGLERSETAPTASILWNGVPHRAIDLPAAAGGRLERLPWTLRLLLENQLRCRPAAEAAAAADAILQWLDRGTSLHEIAFAPRRILMHDTTCGPALVDIAAMRDVIAEHGGDPARLVPSLPVDVSVDHSLAVDHFATPDAPERNLATEMRRNAERYRLMKWAAATLPGFRIHPPGTGIMHTINLDRLATIVATETRDATPWVLPDTLLGTDSHTPMVNGIGVLAWGVGGLEAEGAMFGIPVMQRIPDVVGFRLTGRLPDGVLATDLALTVTERLRRLDLSGRFVEFFGPGVATLTAGERAVVANMAPEYGASTGYFPVDEQCCRHLAERGRADAQVDLVRTYAMRTGLWFDPEAVPRYSEVVEIDLSGIRLSLAGPRRPQDLLAPAGVRASLPSRVKNAGIGGSLPEGAVAIAAITSCTNTSDPRLLIAAGLLARNARRLGLASKPWVKTSLAPGSPAAEGMLRRAGLLDDLEAMGFGIVGYGCTTCIGNSGALTAPFAAPGASRPVAVLSGNRNFPGRVHPAIESAFLVSPPLVIAYALAGDVDRDIAADAIGTTKGGKRVFLADLWPAAAEIDSILGAVRDTQADDLAHRRAAANPHWEALSAPMTPRFPWDDRSTYLRRPPFAALDLPRFRRGPAYPLLVLGDDVTTDHISPAGQIPVDSVAGRHLQAHGEAPADLNVYASRRGNWEVMLRGMFANRSVRNLMLPDEPAGFAWHAPSGTAIPIWQASRRYTEASDSLVIVAGERYGTGSSRDWAAKGLRLLGVGAVLAASFERIHRTNLVGMGILPLQFPADRHPSRLGLSPGDRIEVDVALDALQPRQPIAVAILRGDGRAERFACRAAVETRLEVDLLQVGGMIPYILRHNLASGRSDRPAA